MEEKLHNLRTNLSRLGPTLVAFSGGVDSSFLLAVAAEVLRGEVIALMTVSSSTPPEDAEQARGLADALNVQLLVIPHDELAMPEYAANPTNRCYFCKNSLYDICQREARRLSLRSIVDGLNLDDLGDYRPGIQAATEYSVVHPLVEARFSKADIRACSKLLGLPTWEKPASPCLSSRVPYGTPITAKMLSQIAQAESFIRGQGFQELRVRHHGTTARIEIRKDELPHLSVATVEAMRRKLKESGFASSVLDLEGFRSGVFNEGLGNSDK
ncbi:MAG: ATP-dependent sacrificial sulfur transferase LarE [Deltaproteobacteria bacterium]|nr:ATP-dependent sacrificial sulfur transferase LarE [Deltaproteobacteria bacterium]